MSWIQIGCYQETRARHCHSETRETHVHHAVGQDARTFTSPSHLICYEAADTHH